MDRDDPAYPGQRDYGRMLLALYDPIVIGFVAKAVWRFPDEPLIDLYRTNIRDNHLDIGPGTGYLIGSLRASRRQPRHPRRPQPDSPQARLEAPAPPRHHRRRG